MVLLDDSQQKVAVMLTNQYLERLEKIPEYHNLTARLTEARDAMWPKILGNKETFYDLTAQRREKFIDILKDIKTDQDYLHFAEAMGKMGHLYEVAGQLARDNYFAKQVINGQSIPHGSEEYITKSFKTPAEAVEQLNKSNFEATFTSHPTNNNSLEVMQSIRALGEAASDLRQQEKTAQHTKTFDKAMDDFVKARLVPEKNFTVADETRQMLMFAGNAYEDLAATYRHFDRALEAKAIQSGKPYDPLSVNLGVKFNFWGSSGDKDGNKQVNADTTLQAAYMHTTKIAELLAADVDHALKNPKLSGRAGKDFQDVQEKLKDKLKELHKDTKKLLGDYASKPIPEKEFDTYSSKLSSLAPDTESVMKAASAAYTAGHYAPDDETGRNLLMLFRRARTFGPHMGKIEYRETAEELTKIVGMLINPTLPTGQSYKEMSEKDKETLLTHLLESGKAKEMLNDAAWNNIRTRGFGHNFDKDPYPKDNPSAIAYHTLKRLEIARDNPNLVANHVMAECQGLSNKLELLLLMHAVEKDGKKAVLGIVPLYEDPDVLKKVGEIERDSYHNPEYMKHLKAFTEAHPDECALMPDGKVKLTQQVQFAHSDNRRRGGPAAAVGFIDQAHREYRAAAEEAGIEPRNYQGGSLSDGFRNGIRAVSAMISEFGLYKFAKLTFQGGDLLNYFGHPHSAERLITRAVVHCAKHYDDAPPGDLKNSPYENIAIKALTGTMEDYEKNIFKSDKIGLVLANAGFGPPEMNAGNVGTRTQRDPKLVFSQVSDTDIPKSHGSQMNLFPGNNVTLANPDSIRTISFSELLEHAGAYPTWLGTRTLAENVDKALDETLRSFPKPFDVPVKEAEKMLTQKTELANHALTGERLEQEKAESLSKGQAHSERQALLFQALYSKSAAFREQIDRMAFGIAMANLDTLENLNPTLKGTEMMDNLKKEYIEAGEMVLSALNARHRSRTDGMKISGSTECAAMRQAVTNSLTNLKPILTDRRNFMEFMNYFKRKWLDDAGHKGQEPPKDLLYATHCAMDAGATHARWLPADDPAYGEAISGTQLTRGNGRV